jgi:hypothetical protein
MYYIIYEVSTDDANITQSTYQEYELENVAYEIQKADEETPTPEQEYVIALVIE